MWKKILFLLVVLATILIAYLLFWPVPIAPVAWQPPELKTFPESTSKQYLNSVERITIGKGPEDLAFDRNGVIYTGLSDGRIVRLNAWDAAPQDFASTGGRPLGLVFDNAGNLIVADARRGLLQLHSNGSITDLSPNAGRRRVHFANDVDVAEDGTIYFSEASSKFSIDEALLDLLEHRPNGRLLAYDPRTKKSQVLLDHLYFANGVAVSPDQSFVLVAETWKYRILRYWLKGPKKGKSDVLIDNLPGFPDNITTSDRNFFWVALPQGPETRKNIDSLLPHVSIRKILARLPQFVLSQSGEASLLLALTVEGEIVLALQTVKAPAYSEITSATEHGGFLYLGSIREDGIARLPEMEVAALFDKVHELE